MERSEIKREDFIGLPVETLVDIIIMFDKDKNEIEDRLVDSKFKIDSLNKELLTLQLQAERDRRVIEKYKKKEEDNCPCCGMDRNEKQEEYLFGPGV